MDILLVEDDPQLVDQVSEALVRAGHAVDRACDGPGALDALLAKPFDLMLLNVNLQGFDGFEVLSRVRHAGLPVRVLMLATHSEIGDRMTGSKRGPDGYLAKPFALDELLSRVDGMVLQNGKAQEAPGPVLRVGTLAMDLTQRGVLRGEERIALSPRESEVLTLFMSEPGRTFSRDEICARIWAREHEYDTRTVEMFVMRLRKKLDRPGNESVIATVRGVGYVMRVPQEQ